MNDFSKIHIWMGTTTKTQEEYERYFELDYSTEGDFDTPQYKQCLFCIDINQKWYDEDLIGIMPLFLNNKPIIDLLKDIPLDKKEIGNIINRCNNHLELKFGNAVFYYINSSLKLEESYKKRYNDLIYIGVFSSSLV